MGKTLFSITLCPQGPGGPQAYSLTARPYPHMPFQSKDKSMRLTNMP
jgi:hypothetical protein